MWFFDYRKIIMFVLQFQIIIYILNYITEVYRYYIKYDIPKTYYFNKNARILFYGVDPVITEDSCCNYISGLPEQLFDDHIITVVNRDTNSFKVFDADDSVIDWQKFLDDFSGVSFYDDLD